MLLETSLRGVRVGALNVVETQSGGLVSELTVFFRPLAALELVSEVIGAHMAARFGARPQLHRS